MANNLKIETKNIKEKDCLTSPLDSSNEAEANFYFSKWFGAIFFYLFSFGQYPFEYFEKKKYSRRNIIVGYFAQIIIVGLLIYVMFKYLPA